MKNLRLTPSIHTDDRIMECPVCNSNLYEPFHLEADPYLILSCDGCGHLYCANCSSIPAALQFSDDYFVGGEAGYSNYIEEEPLLVKRGHYYSRILNKLSVSGYMLDVGCAAGFLMKGFRDNGWRVHGVEPNSAIAKYGKTKFGFEIDVSDFESYMSRERFDLICMIQVIAHFRDVRKCVNKASQLLQPNGLLLVETWNKNSLISKIMGKAWHEFSPPSVKNWFTPHSLKMLIEQHGMKVLKSQRTLKKISKRHAASLVGYKSKEFKVWGILGKILKLIPEKIDFVYPGDDLFWMICRKS